MNAKVFRAKKSWIISREIILFCVIFLYCLKLGVARALVIGLLGSLAGLAIWILGPKKIHLGEVEIDNEKFAMEAFWKKVSVRWDDVKTLRENRNYIYFGGITSKRLSLPLWGPNELYTVESKVGEKVGFSSETEDYEELLETIVNRASLELVGTSLVHGGRIWVKECETYEKKSKAWFNWLAVFVILFFIVFGIYLIWIALNRS